MLLLRQLGCSCRRWTADTSGHFARRFARCNRSHRSNSVRSNRIGPASSPRVPIQIAIDDTD
jgi:hypothetical protein